jgi:lipoate-protein ligase A
MIGRLLPFQVGAGAEHMALDERLLRRAAAGQDPATLRFYRWHPPAVSVGYGQGHLAGLAAACARRGWDLVRRPTGGRGILHRGSLTYALVLPPGGAWASWTVTEATRRIHEGLARGLRRLGIPAAVRPPAPDGPAGGGRDPARRGGGGARPGRACCLLQATPTDLLVDGRRVGGSAQRRAGGAILQHGILLEAGEVEAWAAAFQLPPAAIRLLAESTRSLAALGGAADDPRTAAGLADGLGEVLGIAWDAGQARAGPCDSDSRTAHPRSSRSLPAGPRPACLPPTHLSAARRP